MGAVLIESIRVAVMLGAVVFLHSIRRKNPELSRRAWNRFLLGFSLLLFGSTLGLIEELHGARVDIFGSTLLYEILEKIVGFVGGTVCLAAGFIVWLPELVELKRAGERSRELAEANERLRERADVKDAFLSTMSHEIRTPLNGVIGAAQLLLDTRLDVEQREYTQTLYRAAGSLMKLLNDILDFSRIRAGNMELEMTQFEIRRITDDVLDVAAFGAAEKELDLNSIVDPAVPLLLDGDLLRLRQVLVNLVGNAIKFTEKGSVTMRTRLVEKRDDRYTVEFSVADTGIGISADRLDALFEPFSQADVSTTRKYGGSGLGLAITRRLVDMMDGEIAIESELGRGTVVTIRLPFSTTPNSTESRYSALGGKNVLVISTSPYNREALRGHLEFLGYIVIEAESTDQTAARLSGPGTRFQFLIIDSSCFDVGGKLERTIASSARLPRKILQTTLGNGESFRLAMKNYSGFLSKPVRFSQLVDCLNREAPREIPGTKLRFRSERETELPRCSRVLLVDDNEINQRVALRILTKSGFDVDTADDGLQALRRVERGNYDLVLMDCQMPEMDGYEATARIRELGGEAARVPVIAITANALAEDREKCIAAGMDHYVAKPVRWAQLLELMWNILDESTEPAEPAHA